MSRYDVYLTRWDAPEIIEGPLPISGLSFTMPLCDHGECTFSATVEPARSQWRPALAPLVSGIVVVRDDVPIWSGRVVNEEQVAPRTFQFHCAEWGSFFENVAPIPRAYQQWNDHDIFRDLIASVQAYPQANPGIVLGTTVGSAMSDLTINYWDDARVESLFRGLGDAQGGPEWYFGTTGTFAAPQRVLVLGDSLGTTTPNVTLEYVETSEPYEAPAAPPVQVLLGNVFPGVQPYAVVGRRGGGNVIAHPARKRDGSLSASVTKAFGSGVEAAQKRSTRTSQRLWDAGWPSVLYSASYPDVSIQATLDRHADADLAERAGLVTSYTFTTFDDNPDWTGVARGDHVQVVLDTDVYADGVTTFNARLLEIAVAVSDNDRTQVNWTVATRLET